MPKINQIKPNGIIREIFLLAFGESIFKDLIKVPYSSEWCIETKQ
jgi:hypothetical protein